MSVWKRGRRQRRREAEERQRADATHRIQSDAIAAGGEIPAGYQHKGDRLLADIARAKYGRWKEAYKPIENAYIDRVLGFDTLATRNAIVGRGVASAEQGMPGTTGVRPYSAGGGRFINERVMAALARGGARSAAVVEGDAAVSDRALSGRTGLVRFGQGLSEQGATSLGQAAAIRRAGDAARDRAKAAVRASNQELIGTAIGAGAGYYAGRPGAKQRLYGPDNIGQGVEIGPDGWPI